MPADTDTCGRRQFLRRSTAATIGAGAAYYGGSHYAGSPVQNGQAIAPVLLAGAVGVGWLLRETEVVGADDTSTGLTPDALQNDIYDTGLARQSTNKSTIVDNENIVDGLKHTAYADGKIAAIEQLNNGATQQTVETAAIKAVDDYEITVLTNLLKSWNEACNEADNLISAAKSHTDLNVYNVFNIPNGGDFNSAQVKVIKNNATVSLPDGSSMSVHECRTQTYLDNGNYSGTFTWSPAGSAETDGYTWTGPYLQPSLPASDTYSGDLWDTENIRYMDYGDWGPIYDNIRSTIQSVRDGLVLWVDKVYSEVQSGELDTGELLTPREQAQLSTSDSDFPQAIADLQALNISTDLEREAKIRILDNGVEVAGSLAYTADSGSLSVGTVEPSTLSDDIYLTYDVSQGGGNWTAYQTAVDGGVVTFTSEPLDKTEFNIKTTAGDTVVALDDDFTDNGDGTWSADLSADLETNITEVESVTMSAPVDETQYQTVHLKSPFEILSFTDSEGNNYNSADFKRSDPQTDSNYITEEQWKEQQQRNQELIEKYEESQSGGGGINLAALDAFGIPVEIVGAGIAVVGGFILMK